MAVPRGSMAVPLNVAVRCVPSFAYSLTKFMAIVYYNSNTQLVLNVYGLSALS